MDNGRVIALTVPADVGLASDFLNGLEVMMAGALGRGRRMREWYEVDFEETASELPQAV